LVTVTALVALYHNEQMASHMRWAIDNGVLIEVITQLVFYTGWPNAMTATLTAKNLLGPSEEQNAHRASVNGAKARRQRVLSRHQRVTEMPIRDAP
jgi:hypothetical protein